MQAHSHARSRVRYDEPGSEREQAEEEDDKDGDDDDGQASLPRELLWVSPAAQAWAGALQAREECDDVVDARKSPLELALVALGLDRAHQKLSVQRLMLSIESLDVLDSLFLLRAADAVLAQLRLHFLQLQLSLKEFLTISFVFVLRA